MPRASGLGREYWQTQLPIDYLDATIVQNVWETVSADLSEGKPARLWYIYIEQTNNGATQETVALELTINGTAYTDTLTLDSGVRKYVFVQSELAGGDFFLVDNPSAYQVNSARDADQSAPFTCKSVGLIRVRQTSGVDVVAAQIEVNVVWDKLQG